MIRLIARHLIPLLCFGPAVLAADDPKPAPVVLDDATLAKLREIAFQAAREGDVKTLTAYFNAKLPADVANEKADTLLILASYHGQGDAVRLILDQPKTPIEARNKMGFTAITGAAYRGHLAIVKQLVAKGSDVNAANGKGQTPLMYAAMFGKAEVVAFLVESKADLDRKDDQGRDALALAEQQGRDEVVELLREAKAKAKAKAKAEANPRP